MRSSRPPLAPALTLLLLASLLSAAPTLGGDGASADADAFDGTADARVGARGRLDAALRALFPDGPPDSRGDGAGASAVYAAPPGRVGALGDVPERELAFARWFLEPTVGSSSSAGDDAADRDRAPPSRPASWMGPLELRRVHGRGRGLVTTRPVRAGETLMRIPLAKCLSAASARLSPIGVALASDAARDAAPTTEATLALHLLHELYVRADDSPWYPYLRILPKDIGTPLMWRGRDLAHLEGSNVVGFRDAILRRWGAQRDALFPALTDAFPELFPEEHFRASRWTWAMAIVWSRAAHVPAGARGELFVVAPMLDMFNHGFEHGDRGGGGGSRDDAFSFAGDSSGHSSSSSSSSGAAIAPAWDAKSGTVSVVARAPLPGPGHEARFNYGDKPSQYFLLQYGFVPAFNPSECVEVALRGAKGDPLAARKAATLEAHDLDPRSRNFHFFPRRLDPDLLAATRVQMMTEAELEDPRALAAVVAGAPASDANEAKTRAMLLKAAHDMLARYPTTLWEDEEAIRRAAEEEAYPSADARRATWLRAREKETLLASATLVLEQLSPRLSEETCEERYVEARKIEACLRRATGEAFDVFEEPPARNGGDDESESESEGESESARGGDDAAKEEL